MLGLGNTLSGGIVPAAAAADNPVHDFTTGSVPTGWLDIDVSWTTPSGYSSAQPETSWADPNDASSGNYFWLRGDASNNRTHYPLRYATALQGDYLFQLSFYAGDITCRDWGIVLSPDDASAAADATKWRWAWAVETSRIAVQANCTNPTIYGFTETLNSGATIDNDGALWFTYHMYSRPSVPSTTMIVTLGQDDWDVAGTQQGTTRTINEAVVGDVSTDYWFGIGGDFDPISYAGGGDAQAWAKANAARITAL
mgnify:CR=1 FL=1